MRRAVPWLTGAFLGFLVLGTIAAFAPTATLFDLFVIAFFVALIWFALSLLVAVGFVFSVHAAKRRSRRKHPPAPVSSRLGPNGAVWSGFDPATGRTSVHVPPDRITHEGCVPVPERAGDVVDLDARRKVHQ